MVKVFSNFINSAASLLIIVMFLMATLSGCSSYHFGDVSKSYCYSTSDQFRANIKATLEDNGVKIGVNYCASVGLVDALIVKEHER